VGCIPYQTVRDARQALDNTFVLYRGQPVYVEYADGPGGVVGMNQITVRAAQLPFGTGSGYINFNLDDPHFDITSMRIGFTNTEHDAHWCSRYPHRGNQQGLGNGNVSVQYITKTGREPGESFANLARTTGFLDMFSGRYPTTKEILESFKQDKTIRSRAFGRLFALTFDEFRGDYVVYYRTEPVAYGNIESGRVKLVERHSHLREQLMEFGFNVN
jgi:hypothetical protein